MAGRLFVREKMGQQRKKENRKKKAFPKKKTSTKSFHCKNANFHDVTSCHANRSNSYK